MASGKVTKRGKNWQITISMGYDENGKQNRKRWISKALKESNQLLRDKVAELEARSARSLPQSRGSESAG